MKNIQIETKICINGKVQTFENLENKYFSIDFCAISNISLEISIAYMSRCVILAIAIDRDAGPAPTSMAVPSVMLNLRMI